MSHGRGGGGGEESDDTDGSKPELRGGNIAQTRAQISFSMYDESRAPKDDRVSDGGKNFRRFKIH